MRDEPTDASRTITLQGTPLEPAALPTGQLAVVWPPELARVIALDPAPLTLGRRADGPRGVLAHATVSREHLTLAWDGRSRTHVAVDLGSHNGSWLDGAPLAPDARTPLGDGAVLRVGGVVCVYEGARLGDDRDAPELEAALPGVSAAMRRLRRAVANAGPDPSPAVVVGETGAGKEHVARTLHRLSGRGGPLVAVNVTELTAELAESQLFGHVRGAFTGADRAQPGLFRAAHGGTLFLDEIGELAPALQPKLLRALQEGEVRPVGATRTEAVDARIVAATNRELRADIDAGRFRRDLYARLALWELRVPALRERRADIPMWIGRFHRAWCAERGRGDLPPLRFEPEAIERLLLAGWPENLRGLDRLVHRLAHDGAQGLPIARALVDEVLGDAAPSRPSAHDPERDDVDAVTAGEPPKRPAPATAEELLAVIAAHEGSIRGAARWYGRHRKQVYRWLDAFGVDRDAL